MIVYIVAIVESRHHNVVAEAVDLEPVFLLDLDGRITQWNAAAKALLNCGEAGWHVTGTSFYEQR